MKIRWNDEWVDLRGVPEVFVEDPEDVGSYLSSKIYVGETDPAVGGDIPYVWLKPSDLSISVALANYAKAEKSGSNQNISTLSQATVTLGAEAQDGNGLWVAGAPDRLTIQRDGVYDITAGLSWAANSSGSRHIIVYKNGASLGQAVAANAGGTEPTRHQVHIPLVTLAVGDYLTLDAYNGSNVTVAIATGSLTFLAVALRY